MVIAIAILLYSMALYACFLDVLGELEHTMELSTFRQVAFQLGSNSKSEPGFESFEVTNAVNPKLGPSLVLE